MMYEMKNPQSHGLQTLSCKAIHSCIKLKQSRKIKDFQAKKHIPARICRYAYGYARAHMKTHKIKTALKSIIFYIFIHRSNYRNIFSSRAFSFIFILYSAAKKKKKKSFEK